MKIAVYSIAKNESKHVERWADSNSDADYRLVVDTGSTDDTLELLDRYDIKVMRATVKPWDFSFARNIALAFLPSDIDWCIVQDMDELLDPGWREKFDDSGTRKKTRYNLTPEGPCFIDDRRIHRRFGYQWRFPVHEEIFSYGGNEDELVWSDISFTHRQDLSKPRNRLKDLTFAANDYPWSVRMKNYLLRELGMLTPDQQMMLLQPDASPEERQKMLRVLKQEPEEDDTGNIQSVS